MIGFGIGEILGCFFIGYIIDLIGPKKSSWVNVVICIVMSVSVIVYIVFHEWSWLAYVMCFLWGFQDSAVNTHV